MMTLLLFSIRQKDWKGTKGNNLTKSNILFPTKNRWLHQQWRIQKARMADQDGGDQGETCRWVLSHFSFFFYTSSPQPLCKRPSSSGRSKRSGSKKGWEANLRPASLVTPSLRSPGGSTDSRCRTQRMFRSSWGRTAPPSPWLTAASTWPASTSAGRSTTRATTSAGQASPSTVSDPFCLQAFSNYCNL